MRRLQLFEFEDLPWFPHSLRSAMTNYLAATYKLAPLPKLWAERLAGIAAASGQIVDLASGSGGPIPLVIEELDNQGIHVTVTLTDRFPNTAPSHPSVTYWPQPVDADNVPASLAGVRTMFAGFHHFPPPAARKILTDAFQRRRSICIFEATARTPVTIASALLIPLFVLVLTPSVRPLSWIQILFTYFIPILPILMFWDGIVSHLRTYSVEELREFTAPLQSSGYSWEIGEIKAPGLPVAMPYLIGKAAPVYPQRH